MSDAQRWAGLLRAVNVGGRRLTMSDLRGLVEDAGYRDVSTLLASGNVLFTAPGSQGAIRARLEQAIKQHAGFEVEVLLRSKQQLARLLLDNPYPNGQPAHVLVGFLDGSATDGLHDTLTAVAVNEQVTVAGHEVWLHCVDGIGRSKLAAALPRLVKPRIVTARNIGTVAKLVDRL